METKSPPPPTSTFWWMKTASKSPPPNLQEPNGNNPSLTVPRLELDISSSLAEFLDNEENLITTSRGEVDVGSILEEINRVAALSPLGPYEKSAGERSIEDIMREAEKIYMESSKSFEQLSQRSKTSQNVSELGSSDTTPTPKSISPLPLDGDKEKTPVVSDDEENSDEDESYSQDFSMASSHVSEVVEEVEAKEIEEKVVEAVESEDFFEDAVQAKDTQLEEDCKKLQEELDMKNDLVKTLEDDNKALRSDIREIKVQLSETKLLLDQTRTALNSKTISSPEINLELERVLENLKDSQENNTALQLQLDGLNKSHLFLKNSYDDLFGLNKTLERRVLELDSTLDKYKQEILILQKSKDALQTNELNLTKLLEIEKLQCKSVKLQNEKDAKCIQDLNRQIKEMERIISRKHPDSVSALIVAAKSDVSDSNLTARRVLEERIKTLEQEASNRDSKSSKVFLDIQDKFNQMKLKYESHIEDLELHVSDLKSQLKRRIDTYDVYTQTYLEEQKIPEKDTVTISTQTEALPVRPPKVIAVKRSEKAQEMKEETHLLATIRGLQADLANKEKVVLRQQKEVDELRKTNRRLQKEREGSLRSLTEKREFRSYPEKLDQESVEEELRLLRLERDKMKQQLVRLEDDYQALKTKRLDDLNALQEAHEQEISSYVNSLQSLREQQMSLTTLKAQLNSAKEELAIITVERDHLSSQLDLARRSGPVKLGKSTAKSLDDVQELQQKIFCMEQRYEERQNRLRAIIHGLAQKNVASNRSCDQCEARQQQLVGYKVELDQLLATVRALK